MPARHIGQLLHHKLNVVWAQMLPVHPASKGKLYINHCGPTVSAKSLAASQSSLNSCWTQKGQKAPQMQVICLKNIKTTHTQKKNTSDLQSRAKLTHVWACSHFSSFPSRGADDSCLAKLVSWFCKTGLVILLGSPLTPFLTGPS